MPTRCLNIHGCDPPDQNWCLWLASVASLWATINIWSRYHSCSRERNYRPWQSHTLTCLSMTVPEQGKTDKKSFETPIWDRRLNFKKNTNTNCRQVSIIRSSFGNGTSLASKISMTSCTVWDRHLKCSHMVTNQSQNQILRAFLSCGRLPEKPRNSKMVDESDGILGSRTNSLSMVPWHHTPCTLNFGFTIIDMLFAALVPLLRGTAHFAWSIPSSGQEKLKIESRHFSKHQKDNMKTCHGIMESKRNSIHRTSWNFLADMAGLHKNETILL